MKIIVTLLSVLIISYSYAQQKDTLKIEKSYPNKQVINLKEELIYNVYYSFLKVAEIKSITNDSIYNIYNKICYKVDVLANTGSITRWFAPINEIFGSYIDTATLLPVLSYRYLKENNYLHDEISYFDYSKKEMRLTLFNQSTRVHEEKGTFALYNGIYDPVGMYVHLRDINFQNKKIGDLIFTNMYIEDKLFPIVFTLDKYEKIKIKAGKFNSIKLIISIANNPLFNKDYPMAIWISNDANNIVLSMEAKMKVGKMSIELKTFNNTRHSVNSKL